MALLFNDIGTSIAVFCLVSKTKFNHSYLPKCIKQNPVILLPLGFLNPIVSFKCAIHNDVHSQGMMLRVALVFIELFGKRLNAQPTCKILFGQSLRSSFNGLILSVKDLMLLTASNDIKRKNWNLPAPFINLSRCVKIAKM